MDVLIIIGLIVAGILLFLIELFVIPGISLAGIGAVVSLVYAIYYAFAYMGEAAGFITLAASIITCVASTVLFMRSKTLEKISLKKSINSSVDNKAERSVSVGDLGQTVTRLALIGMAEINGHHVEVKSTSGLMDEHTAIRVARIEDGTILVEKQN